MDTFFPIIEHLAEHLKKDGAVREAKIGWHCHLTALTELSARALLAGGAELFISECNRDTTDPRAVERMLKAGITIFEGINSPQEVLKCRPILLADTGLVLITEHVKNCTGRNGEVIAASEITTSGITRLRLMESLTLPVVNINDGLLKTRIENFHGVGDGVVELLRRITGRSWSGARAAVIGFGSVGAGVAQYLKKEGALVTVVERNPSLRLIAHYDGYGIAALSSALAESELIVTATGKVGLLKTGEWQTIRDGALVVNVGHWRDELDLECLRLLASGCQKVNEHIEEFTLSTTEGREKRVYVACDGSPANIVLLTGSIEPTLIHLTTEALCLAYLARHGRQLEAGETPIPPEVEAKASELALRALGIE
ncbi:MAG TPA: NAD(P)-dependent oxidoreductase [Candidatus Obscuribacterales bacterium]